MLEDGLRLLIMSLRRVSGVSSPQSEKRGSLMPVVGSGGGGEGRSRGSEDASDVVDVDEEEGEIAGPESDTEEGKRRRGSRGRYLSVQGRGLY